jgi:hypothetical protein
MIFSCCSPYGKAGAIQIRRCPGIAVDDCGGTLGALALNRSGFCNVGVYQTILLQVTMELNLMHRQK